MNKNKGFILTIPTTGLTKAAGVIYIGKFKYKVRGQLNNLSQGNRIDCGSDLRPTAS